MKFAAWQITAVGGALLLAAGSLYAQAPEMLPEPSGTSSILGTQNSPSLENWLESQHGPSNSQPKNSVATEQVVPGHVTDGDHSMMMDDGGPVAQKAFPASSGYWWRNGCWYGDIDFVIWNRTRPKEQILGADTTTSSTGATILLGTLDSLGRALPLQAGGRGTLGYIVDRDTENRDHSFEVTYLGFNNWEQSDSLEARTTTGLFTPEDQSVPGFNGGVSTYTTTYRSDLQSLELDYRIRNRPGRDQMVMGPDGFWSQHVQIGRTESMFVGIRGLSEEEKFHWVSNPGNTSITGDLENDTKNHLLGFQLGGDCYDVHESFYWGIKGDAGIYCNFASGFERVITTPTLTTPIDNSATNQVAAFFGELSLVAGYNLSDHVIIHTSYDLAQMGGLALAPNEVSFTTKLAAPEPFIRNAGQIFFQGFSLGLDAYW